MEKKQIFFINQLAVVMFVLIALIAILYIARPVLAPLAFALVFALLLVPLSRRLEKAGMNRALAAVICVIILLASFALIFGLLGWQLSAIMQDSGQLKQRLQEIAEQVQNFLSQRLGIQPAKQKQMMNKADLAEPLAWLTQSVGQMLGLLVDIVLTLVYVFLLMAFRGHFLQFIAKAVPGREQANVAKLLREVAGVSQQYLIGLALMIMSLWVMYAIGFSIVGVRYAIFFALLCGTLEMVPFVGNITGTTLTAMMGVLQGGGTGMVLSILATYGLVQFIQSYILQPMVVGREVNLNPFFTIFCIVIGDAVWGVAGMVLAIPVFGMLKIFCDHFEPLKPYGFLLGGKARSKKGPNFSQRGNQRAS